MRANIDENDKGKEPLPQDQKKNQQGGGDRKRQKIGFQKGNIIRKSLDPNVCFNCGEKEQKGPVGGQG